MKNDVGLGFGLGFLASFVGTAWWMVEPESDPLAAVVVWALPATALLGLALLLDKHHRRLGGGLLLGALAVAMMTFGFLVWLASQIGS